MKRKEVKDIAFEGSIKINEEDIALQFKKEELEGYRQDRE